MTLAFVHPKLSITFVVSHTLTNLLGKNLLFHFWGLRGFFSDLIQGDLLTLLVARL